MCEKTALVLVANGSEEMETVITVDVLRRGGVKVTLASVSGEGPVRCSRDVSLVPDTTLNEASLVGPYDIVVMPGGLAGAQEMCKSKEVGRVLKDQQDSDRYIAAICAAPTALKDHGIGLGKRVTSYPAMADTMKDGGKYEYLEQPVVVDGKLITSRGPGTAVDFALALVDLLNGCEKAESTAKAMLLEYKRLY